MLRITVHHLASTALLLEGRLAGDWVHELRIVWRDLQSVPSGKGAVVCLTDVSGVDAAGRQLLAEIHAGGGVLTGSGLLARALIEEITRSNDGAVVPRCHGGIQKMHKRIVLGLSLLLALPAALGARQSMELGLNEAVEVALEPDGNVRIQLAREAVRQAEAHAALARAELLPDIAASVGQQSQTRSLTAYGLQSEKLGGGFQLPGVVGPFSTFDARANAALKLFDLSSIRRFQAAKAGREAAREDDKAARDQTAAEVARAYLAAVRAQAMVETARANVDLGDALLKLAASQKEAGSGTGIDVTRAQVQLANNRQQLLAAQTDFTRSRLQLLKLLGIDLDIRLTLTDRLEYAPGPSVSLESAVGAAGELLAELRAQRKHEESAALNYRAASVERLLKVVGYADYGTVGLSASRTSPTRTFGASVEIPIFDGGRREARRAESLAALRQERIRTQDLEDEISLRIRVALDAMQSADAQVQTAEAGLSLSQDELQQAERRYQAGVGTSLEVTDAQTRLQRSQENRISAVFNHALARVDLAAAMGTIQEITSNWR